MDSTPIDEVVWGFVGACSVDYQLFAGLVEDAEEALCTDDALQLRRFLRSILGRLIGEGLVEAGFPKGMGTPAQPARLVAPDDLEQAVNRMVEQAPSRWTFTPWLGPAEQIVDEIMQAWNQLGRDPGFDEVCWFRATDKGKAELARSRVRGSARE